MIQVKFDNQPDYRLSEPILIDGYLTYIGQYNCGICHKWSNVNEFFIVFDRDANKTVYKCPKCKAESTFFHTPIEIDDSKRLTFNELIKAMENRMSFGGRVQIGDVDNIIMPGFLCEDSETDK